MGEESDYFAVIGLICLLLAMGLAKHCHAEESGWDAVMHGAAHYGGGTLAAELAHTVDRKWTPLQRMAWETGWALAVNLAYKAGRHELNDPLLWPKMGAGALGGYAFFTFSY